MYTYESRPSAVKASKRRRKKRGGTAESSGAGDVNGSTEKQ